jgi:hypothetical protein
MARTVNTPPRLPNPSVNGGMQIVGEAAAGDKGRSWGHLLRAVNSLFAHKLPCLVVDTHASKESWLGYDYPTGSANKHHYRFPHPLHGLSHWAGGHIGVYLRGVRTVAHVGGTTSWVVNVLNGKTGGRTSHQVNGGAAGGAFLWHLGDFECIPGSSGALGDFDIYLETFGAALGFENWIDCLLIQPKVVLSGSELPLGVWGAPNGFPLYALDPDIWAGSQDSAHAAMIATAGALLENIYRRRQPVFMSSSNAWPGVREQRMWNNTSTWRTFAKLRASELLADSPGVSFLVFVEDAKFDGDAELRLTAGASAVTIPNASLGTGVWCPLTSLDCRAGDVVEVEGRHIKIGTVMIFGREATP